MSDSISEGRRDEYLGGDAARPGGLLVLDFDGVICDSLPECYVSSFHAHRGLDQPHPGLDTAGAFGRFTRLRPFVRSGEDYLLIHETEDGALSISDQAEFDALIAHAGPEGMRERKRRLYAARDRLIAGEPEYWLSLNPVYPHMAALLPRLAASPRTVVLSTKRADLVARILRHHGVVFPSERLLEPGPRAKLDVIRELMHATASEHAVFVDDQVDHFRDSARRSARVRCLLAEWGYVKREWLVDTPDYAVLRAADAASLVSSVLGFP